MTRYHLLLTVLAVAIVWTAMVAFGPRAQLQSRGGIGRIGEAARGLASTAEQASRSGPVPSSEGAVGRGGSLDSPVQLDDGGGVDSASLSQGRIGKLAQSTTHGPDYLAIPIGPGHLVDVCGPRACWRTVSTDAGPNHSMLVRGRIADVAVGRWVLICGVPAVLGLCDGSWHVVEAGPTPPPTDVSP